MQFCLVSANMLCHNCSKTCIMRNKYPVQAVGVSGGTSIYLMLRFVWRPGTDVSSAHAIRGARPVEVALRRCLVS